MLIYEVNLEVNADAAAAYRRWLDAHVMEILRIDGFLRAEIFSVAPDSASTGEAAPARLCVHYHVRDALALDAYFRDHAPRLRAEGLAKFGDRFRASRRVLQSERQLDGLRR